MKDLLLYEKMDVFQNNFPIKFIYAKRYQCLLPHWHEHYELLYFVDGKCEAFCDGVGMSVNSGDLVVSNSTQVHSFNSDGSILFHALIVSPEMFSDIDLKNKVLINHIRQDPYVKKCFKEIEEAYREYKSGTLGGGMKTKAAVYALFSYLFDNFVEDYVVSEQRSNQLKRLYKVFSYISEHYHQNLTTKELAEMCFVTESYFCRFFKRATGMTLASYITEYRVKKAQLLLENTKDSITSIALSVGFDDSNYFTRMFKNVTGTPPTKYRKKQAKD